MEKLGMASPQECAKGQGGRKKLGDEAWCARLSDRTLH